MRILSGELSSRSAMNLSGMYWPETKEAPIKMVTAWGDRTLARKAWPTRCSVGRTVSIVASHGNGCSGAGGD